IENEYFVKTADGDVAKGPVWPGFCAFPDFTDERVRSWWGSLYDKLFVQDGIAGFWNDMNEPAVFHVNHKTLPDQVMHHFDGNPASHRKGHNVYGMLMTRASFEGLRRLKPGKRPFLLTRASFSGGQRYGAVWTGDNVSSWEHLQIANIQCQRLSVSGFSFCGTDIGGFAGELDPELYVRWLQLAVFHPLMRMHSMGGHQAGDTAITDEAQLTDPSLHTFDREPWSFGDKITDLAKKAIELRYALLPCLYTAFRKHAQDGTPVIRHAAFADPADPKLIDQERDFLFGDHIWVSPVVQAKQQRQMVYLPQGNWYYFWTGQAANGEMFINLMPDQLPFFVREGAVLPVYPVRQWTGERPVDELTLYVYYKNGNETSHLYEDEGEGYAYQEGQYSHKTFETRGQNGNFSLSQQKSGDWEPTYKTVKIYLVGFPAFVRSCLLDGEEIPIKEIRLRDRSLYTLTAAAGFNTVEWHA
ncbi:MAG TPA: glycoside hydrolase family 31 protein, partial [Saprospiraceae bacterium]|nr:glycoside hydrolase family 31 protein [Saprospiraceae bacterium]